MINIENNFLLLEIFIIMLLLLYFTYYFYNIKFNLNFFNDENIIHFINFENLKLGLQDKFILYMQRVGFLRTFKKAVPDTRGYSAIHSGTFNTNTNISGNSNSNTSFQVPIEVFQTDVSGEHKVIVKTICDKPECLNTNCAQKK